MGGGADGANQPWQIASPHAPYASLYGAVNEAQPSDGFISPMARYPELRRTEWHSHWSRTACVVTADDGTFGVGITIHGGPVERIINDHFAPLLAGQDCMATERHWESSGASRERPGVRRGGQFRPGSGPEFAHRPH